VVATVSLICIYAGAQDSERDLNVIAAQIRRQGFICRNPSAAALITNQAPNQKVYRLKCEGVTYRVTSFPIVQPK
jgi:hypothetical protein